MSLHSRRNIVPTLIPEIRKNCFNEVSVGFDERAVRAEAMRCLRCKNPPCVKGCPVNNCIPEFLVKVAEGDYAGALDSILKTHILPSICGRVCPQELQCEGHCVLARKGQPIAIGACERFVGDYGRRNSLARVVQRCNEKRQQKIAIIGSGPAGLSCAGMLASHGYNVTIFEALHEPGGVLRYGIPEFRLPKDIVRRELDKFKTAGVNFEFNTLIGRTLTIDGIFAEGYASIFAAPGAGVPMFSGVKGETNCGVFTANEFLSRINLMKAHLPNAKTPVWCGKNVVVVGGGNTALDAARTAVRLYPDTVTVIYRRTMEDMPARPDEIKQALEEGIKIEPLTAPIEYLGDDNGWLNGVRVCKMRVVDGEADMSGLQLKHAVEKVPDSETIMKADTVIIAIGTKPNNLIAVTTSGIEMDKSGRIIVNPETMMTTRNGVFAGGDIAGGEATVIDAMRTGKVAAFGIEQYLKG